MEKEFIVTKYPHCEQTGRITLRIAKNVTDKEAKKFILENLDRVQWNDIKVAPGIYCKSEIRINENNKRKEQT